MPTLHPGQFGDLGHPGEVPPPMGSTPVPEGMMRFHHYTSSPEAAHEIREHGLLRSKAEESYARGGTESPQTFMTAGVASEDRQRSHIHVEGWVDPRTTRAGGTGQLDIGENWREDPAAEHAAYHEKRQNTLTARGDIPAHQITATHEPWHSTYRYIMGDKRARSDTFHGEHDNLAASDPHLGKAINAAKTASAASVMLGGGI